MCRLAVFIVIISVVTSSCKSSKDNGHLLFWSSNNAQEIGYSTKLIDQWNQNHPGKTIKFQPIPEGQSSEEIILASVVGKIKKVTPEKIIKIK